MSYPRRLLPAGVLLACLMAAPAGQAQLLPSFGITGGLNFASLSDAAGVQLDDSVGFHIGAYADLSFPLLPIGVRGSALFVSAGGIEAGGQESSIRFIAIPVDLKYSLGLPLINPYGFLGPEMRFPMGDIADHPLSRSTAWALNAGVGLDIGLIVGPQLFAELRYGLDLTGFVDADDSIRVSLFYVRFGVGF